MTREQQAWIDFVSVDCGDDAAEIVRIEFEREHRGAKRGSKAATSNDVDASGMDSGQGQSYDPFYTGGLSSD